MYKLGRDISINQYIKMFKQQKKVSEVCKLMELKKFMGLFWHKCQDLKQHLKIKRNGALISSLVRERFKKVYLARIGKDFDTRQRGHIRRALTFAAASVSFEYHTT